jgi:phosphate starvation-inducible protein PhoH
MTRFTSADVVRHPLVDIVECLKNLHKYHDLSTSYP